MKRFEDDYNRDSRRRGDTREDRHGRDRVEHRERRQVVEDRMEIGREATRGDRRDQMDTVMDTGRIPSSMRDSARANTATRLEPRPDRYAMEPPSRRDPPPELYKDPRTGELRDARTGELYQEVPPRPSYPRGEPRGDDRMDRDRMDRDDVPPGRRAREVVESAPPRDFDDDYRSNKYNDYFVPGIGIDREVIQHEICRYLGNDATVRPFTNKDVC
jgi:hypothetical protein